MLFYFNKITVWQIISLLVGFFIPLIILELAKDGFIEILNFYLVSLSVAIIFDSVSLLRIERIFAKRNYVFLQGLVGSILSNYLVYFPFVLIISLIELSQYGFSFIMVGFVRHVTNMARISLIYWFPLDFFKTFINQISVMRNILLILSALVCQSGMGFAFSIYATSVCEVVLVFVVIFVKYHGNILFSCRGTVNGLVKQTRKMFQRPQSWVSLSNAGVGIAERTLAAFILSNVNLTIYLTYKMLPQYIDATYATIGYQVRMYSLSNKAGVSMSAIVLPLLGITCFGIIFSFTYFSIESMLSGIIFISLSLIIAVRRSIDIFKIPILVVSGKYFMIMMRNFFEILISCVVLLFSVMLFQDVDHIFLMVSIFSMIPSFILYLYYCHIGMLRWI
jgi:hypothetical protein